VQFDRCCDDDTGLCVPESIVPATVPRESLNACRGGRVCVPEQALNPDFAPRACSGTFFGSRYEGVCLSECFDLSFVAWIKPDIAGCPFRHRCMPCANPISGEKTGAPGCR
jgi:hypothetical protein